MSSFNKSKMRKKILFFLFIYTSTFLYSQEENASEKLQNMANLSIDSLIQQGNTYFNQNQFDTALFCYTLVSQKYDQEISNAEKNLCIFACTEAGNIYYKYGSLSKALDSYLKGIKICEQNEMPANLPNLYKNIGNVYIKFNDISQAYKYYKIALELVRKTKDQETEFKILNNLIGTTYILKDSIKARQYLKQMKNLKIKDVHFKVYSEFLCAGLIGETEDKYTQAISYYRQAVNYSLQHPIDSSNNSYPYLALGFLYHSINNNDSALYYLNLTYTKYRVYDVLSSTLSALINIYKKKGDLKKVHKLQEEYRILSDSIYNYQEFNNVKNRQITYEIEKVEKKVSDLKKAEKRKQEQIKKQQQILLAISLGLCFFIAAFITIYIQKKRLFNTYKTLYDKNNKILEIEKELQQIQKEYEGESTKERDNIPASAIGVASVSEKENVINPSTKLSEEQKEKLLGDIEKIMENTDEICNSNFNQKKLAELVNSNTSYVSQIINEKYKKNFSTFVNEYKIKEAQKRLSNFEKYGSYTIKTIAEGVGYKSQANFIQAFKAVTGMTPSMYQKIAKERNTSTQNKKL